VKRALSYPFALLAFGLGASAAHANNVTFDGTLTYDGFTKSRPSVETDGFRSQLGASGDVALGDARLSFDIDGYSASYLDAGFVDGVLALSGDAPFNWSVGLLRQEWGQPDATRLGMLVSPNLVYGPSPDIDPVAQPGAALSFNLAPQVVLEATALFGLRTSPLVAFDERGGFGLPLNRVVNDGDLGEGALALRLSGTTTALDWSLHAFTGLSRTPTFVQRGPIEIDAVHDEITQIGYELEAAPGDWRIWSEGFWRTNGRNRLGDVVDYSHATLGAEYQFFAAFGGAADILFGAEVRYDSREENVDQPFLNGVAARLSIFQNSLSGWELDYVYLQDFDSNGTGNSLTISKQLSESPEISWDLSWVQLNAGDSGTVLDALEQDQRISTSITWTY